MNERDDPRRDEDKSTEEPDTDKERDEPPVWDSDDAPAEKREAGRGAGREGAPDEPPW